jgi:hypothetical protein
MSVQTAQIIAMIKLLVKTHLEVSHAHAILALRAMVLHAQILMSAKIHLAMRKRTASTALGVTPASAKLDLLNQTREVLLEKVHNQLYAKISMNATRNLAVRLQYAPTRQEALRVSVQKDIVVMDSIHAQMLTNALIPPQIIAMRATSA